MLNDRFVTIRKHAKIDAKYKVPGFHYTAASELENAVGSKGMLITGHKTREIFDIYAGDEGKISHAITAQAERNKNRSKRESLKPILKPSNDVAGAKGKS